MPLATTITVIHCPAQTVLRAFTMDMRAVLLPFSMAKEWVPDSKTTFAWQVLVAAVHRLMAFVSCRTVSRVVITLLPFWRWLQLTNGLAIPPISKLRKKLVVG